MEFSNTTCSHDLNLTCQKEHFTSVQLFPHVQETFMGKTLRLFAQSHIQSKRFKVDF